MHDRNKGHIYYINHFGSGWLFFGGGGVRILWLEGVQAQKKRTSTGFRYIHMIQLLPFWNSIAPSSIPMALCCFGSFSAPLLQEVEDSGQMSGMWPWFTMQLGSFSIRLWGIKAVLKPIPTLTWKFAPLAIYHCKFQNRKTTTYLQRFSMNIRSCDQFFLKLLS